MKLLSAACLILAAAQTDAKMVAEAVQYKHADASLEGYLAYDDAVKEKRPGVLVVHEWWGLNDFAKEQARRLAELGYVALAVDMYGQGLVTADLAEAAKLSGQFKENPTLLVERATAGLQVLAKHERVDPKRIAAIGFCFGGTTVLALACSGADLAGVVSFHGGLIPPTDTTKAIKARILVLHGAADTLVPPTQVTAFQEALDKAGADWQMITYGGAKHSFTNPAADKLNMPGVGYQKAAAQRSWRDMQRFFDELFGGVPAPERKR